MNEQTEQTVDGNTVTQEAPEETQEAQNETKTEISEAPAQPKKRKRSLQERFSKLTGEIHQLKATIASLEKNSHPEPNQDDFSNYDDYVKALDRHKAAVTSSSKSDIDLEIATASDILNPIYDDVDEEEFPKFQELLADGKTPLSKDILIALSELAEDDDFEDKVVPITYHLMKNPRVAIAMRGSSKSKTMKELMKMSSLASIKTKKTKAPVPINPINQLGKPTKDIHEMTFNEYEEYRKLVKPKRTDGW